MLLFTLQALQDFLYFDTPLFPEPTQHRPHLLFIASPPPYVFWRLFCSLRFSLTWRSGGTKQNMVWLIFVLFFAFLVLWLSGALIHFRVLKKAICLVSGLIRLLSLPPTLWINVQLLLDANQTTVAWTWRDSSFNCHNVICCPVIFFFSLSLLLTLWCGPLCSGLLQKQWLLAELSLHDQVWASETFWHPSAVTHNFCLFLEYNLSIMTLHWFFCYLFCFYNYSNGTKEKRFEDCLVALGFNILSLDIWIDKAGRCNHSLFKEKKNVCT